MWFQCEAPLIGRSPSVDKPSLRQQDLKKEREKVSQKIACECKDQQTLPGLDL